MLKALELENFKAFGERTRIEFAPITLILGENSAGKSSVLQALGLLKQTVQYQQDGHALLPSVEKGIVDLGSYQELLFDHDFSRSLRIKVECDSETRLSIISSLMARLKTDSKTVEMLLASMDPPRLGIPKEVAEFAAAQGLDVAFVDTQLEDAITDGIDNDSREVDFSALEFEFRASSPEEMVRVASLKLFSPFSSEPWAIFECPSHEQELLMDLGDVAESVFGEVITPRSAGFQCSFLSGDSQNWRNFWRGTREVAREIIPGINRAIDDGREREEAKAFYCSDFTLDEFVERMQRVQKHVAVQVNGFIPTDAFIVLGEKSRECNLLHSSNLIVGTTAVFAGKVIRDNIRRLNSLGPLRQPPKRIYMFSGSAPRSVGYSGDSMPEWLFQEGQLTDKVNHWLDVLQVGYHLNLQRLSSRAGAMFEVRLLDKRRPIAVDVALSDVGFGVCQLLPIVVQCVAGKEQILTIEQPEVHVHPKLQADLGSLFAECIQPPTSHQLIVETHSEHLVLRMQKMIRDRKLSPNHVAVIYVSRGPNGSRAQRLRLDDDGDFIDDWPGGFFPERLRELL